MFFRCRRFGKKFSVGLQGSSITSARKKTAERLRTETMMKNYSTKESSSCYSMNLNEYKLNVDATLDVQNFYTCLEAVVRDWEGNIVAGFLAPKTGASLPLFAKAKALLYGLLWCTAIKLPITHIKTDCLQLAMKIKHK
uniref:RNase H type-1 domain-containing protein n=1 Tax=Cannabis sativa TaxID=3483 RepID=A0A803PYM6_CANSA